MSRLVSKSSFLAALLSGILLAPAVFAASNEKISLNFVNANIEEVVRAVAIISKKNFVVDPRVKGTVNIVSSEPVSADLAYEILLSALRLQGFASVESGGVTKVMPEADAKLHLNNTKSGRNAGDHLMTRVYTLKFGSANQLVPVLRPLIAPNNTITVYSNSNTLVITDYASNLKRIEQILNSIDVPDPNEPMILPIKYASAMDVAQTISHLLQASTTPAAPGSGAEPNLIVTADGRTNSLLVRVTNAAELERIKKLINQLDVETSTPGSIHVVYLKNAEAIKMAETLRAVLSGEQNTSSGTSSKPSGTATSQGTTPTGTTTSSTQSAGKATVSGSMIQADSASNALIITAPDVVYNNLRAVIEKLDVRRAQVFVEALVVEVTADKVAEFGVQWQDLSSVNRSGAQLVGGTNFGSSGTNIISTSSNVGTVGNGLNIGLIHGQATIPGLGQIVNLAMLARALETDSNANILSTPNLMTLDNEEAKIIIGQNVPFITGSYAQTGNANTASPFQTIERKDVGLTLRIKPQVSEGGTVRLEIYQEVSSVQNQSISNTAGIITNKRSLESTVLADEGQIVVLGGLIQDSVSDGEDKVPLLGNLPIIGNLFRYQKRGQKKTNLMVFIRPYILRSSEATIGLTQDRYQYLRGEMAASQLPMHPILPEMKVPDMPALTVHQATPAATPVIEPASAATP